MTAAPTTFAVAGTGDEADHLARSLRGVDGVEINRITGTSDDELLEQLSHDNVEAVAFVTPTSDLAGSVRRSLMANRHVLIAGPAALGAAQLASLDDLARRRSRVAFFDAGYAADERVAFVRKMTASPGALWRPRYARVLRTGASRHSLDEIAMAEIACVLSIMGAAPAHVSAIAPRIDDETGHADAVMVTMSFDGGPVVTVHVSLNEPQQRREMVIACDGRTIVMDSFDARAPLQIQAAGRHTGPNTGTAWSETISEFPTTATMMEREALVVAEFVAAVRARDLAAVNLREMALAASAWEAARGSIAAGGEPRELAGEPRTLRPDLQVIQGGGKAAADASPPALTLVRRRNG